MKGKKRWLKRAVLTVGLFAVLAGSWAGYLRLSGNFHAVEEGVIYRSAQLSGDEFQSRIRAYSIRTIINLRGENSERQWYVNEMMAVASTGTRHIDFPISANRDLTDVQLDQLTAILRDAQQPVLVHCEGGADRSGLASAIYEFAIAERSVSSAASQLSFRYGHFPWLGNTTAAMDRSFERVVARKVLSNTLEGAADGSEWKRSGDRRY